jgi:hypothetical protein
MKQDEEGFFDFLLGYRKTLAWFTLFIVAIIFRLKGYIDGGQFVDISKATFLGFISGNLGEHLGNLGKAYFNSKSLSKDNMISEDHDAK